MLEDNVEYWLLFSILVLNLLAVIINIITNILLVKPLKKLDKSITSIYLTVESIDNEVKKNHSEV